MRGTLRVVVMGIMGRMPFAGMAWQGLHFLEGFRRLGHDVWYVEDSGDWPYDPDQNTITSDCRHAVSYLEGLMRWSGLADRWAYRTRTGGARTFGRSSAEVAHVLARADVLVNLHGATVLRDEHLRVPVRIYLETDPVRRQIEVAKGVRRTLDLLSAHTHHFSFGENLGAPDCRVPVSHFRYHPTRQPVVLDWWAGASGPPAFGAAFTTVANWAQTGYDVEWNGETYFWSKHLEFLRFLQLPRHVPDRLELALACDDPAPKQLLAAHGWRVVDAVPLSRDILSYRHYLCGSRGEFTVAKDQNVRLRSGWFSDRSACYLTAGRPIITQETGFSRILPTGEGLFAFATLQEAVAAFDEIARDYERHARAARCIAAEYFRAETVISNVLEAAGCGTARPGRA